MTDPVSNAEIEDVLSSIRRLVSEDPSPLHRRKRIAEGAKERFVLTPALRVSEEGDEADQEAESEAQAAVVAKDAEPTALVEEESAGQQQAAAAVETENQNEADQLALHKTRFAESRQTLEQRIAELESALQESPEEWEPDGSEVAPSAGSDIPAFDDEPDAPDATYAEPDVSPDIERAGTEMPEPDTADAPLDLSKIMEVRPDEAEIVADVPDVDTDEGVDREEDEATIVLSDETVSEVMQPHDIAPDEIEDLKADIAVEATASVPKQDEPEQEPEVETVMVDLQGPTEAEFEAQATDTQDGHAEPLDLFEGDAVLDEEALRDLVSQLVRDELQGVLGERITRNVRRLVRREIQRAVAMRELE